MKVGIMLVCFICGFAVPGLLRGQEPGAEIHLRGIARAGTNQWALLENPGERNPWARSLILGLRQREGPFEVIEIDLARQSVKVESDGQVKELAFSGNANEEIVKHTPSSKRGEAVEQPAFIHLRQAGAWHVFGLYQLLVGRTLIRPAALPRFELSLYSPEPVTVTEAAKGVEQALAEKGILLHPEREKFVLAGRQVNLDRITPELWSLATELTKKRPTRPGPQASVEAQEDMLPTGAINFPDTDLFQVLQIYQELTGRTPLHKLTTPSPPIIFRTYAPVTVNEVVYALSASLAINGISVLPVGDKFLLVFATAEMSHVRRLANRKVAVAAPPPDRPGLRENAFGLAPLDLSQVAELYRNLSGRPVEIAPDLPRVPPFTLQNRTPLTASEALQALDLLLGLYGLAVAAQEDGKSLKVARLEMEKATDK